MSVSLELAYICCETADVSKTQDRTKRISTRRTLTRYVASFRFEYASLSILVTCLFNSETNILCRTCTQVCGMSLARLPRNLHFSARQQKRLARYAIRPSVTRVDRLTRKPCCRRETARCRCKF